jgi:alpha-amylase
MKRLVVATALLAITASITSAPVQAAEDYTKLFSPVARGDQSTESVYFVMTDRFANGDTSNDTGGLTGSDAGFDPTDISYWHGGDFKGLTNHLNYIKNLGFTAIWITPPVKQKSVQGNSSAYHGYWGLDFLSVDPHLGTEADFKNFVDGAHKLGMKVILDVVANHTADVIQYNDGVAYIPTGSTNAKNPGFLNKLSNYHNKGPSTFEGESALVGDFNTLDDIATENPEVVQGFIGIWSFWIKTFGIDGLRIDTFKHVNPEFWKSVIPAIQKVAKESGKKTFPIFGEVYDSSPEALSSYMVSGQTPSVLDFGFNEQVGSFVGSFGTADRLAKLFNSDDLYTTANTSAYGLATFLGNHDMGRIGTIINNNASDKSQALKRAVMAQAALLMLRGGPVEYYGDEKGMTGGGGDKLARQDMFATQVSRWQWEPRIGSEPVGTASAFDSVNPIETTISGIQQVVKANPALRNGTQTTLFAEGQTFIVSRYADKREYIVAFNASDAAKSLTVSPINKSTKWSAISGSCTASSALTINLEANSYCVLKADSLIAKSASTKLTAPRLEASNDSPLWKQLSVTVNAPGYNSVTFLAREKGGKWKSLGTSDRTTFATTLTTGGLYRTFLHTTDFKKGAALEIIAVMKNSDNKVIASPITKAVNS